MTGPEVIAGSTRMKAGTAQKLVLNTISTGDDGPARQDVRESDGRRRRQQREAARPRPPRGRARDRASPDDEVDAALAAADGDAKVAIVSLLTGSHVDDARRRLGEAGGSIRRALEPGT